MKTGLIASALLVAVLLLLARLQSKHSKYWFK
jgi:hypothetical protein